MIDVFIRHRVMIVVFVAMALFFGRNHPLIAAPSAFNLGTANGFNQFILEDVTLTGSRAGGRVAYGGNTTVTSHNIGDDDPTLCDPMLNVAIFGGDVDYDGGQINAGSAVYSGTVISDNFTLTCPGATFTMSVPFDFDAISTEFTTLSDSYAAQTSNGQVNGSNCFVVLKGTTTGENIFSFDGEALLDNASASACGIFIDVPCGATALINVSGETIDLSMLDVAIIGGITPNQVLFNFHEATSISMEMGSKLEGSVFAPMADFTVTGASFINGTLISKSLAGDNFNTDDIPLLTAPTECYDYGDLPNVYGITQQSDDGANHLISDLFLGTTVDGEPDGQEDATASKDDNSAVADEDGITADPGTWDDVSGGAVEALVSQDGCLTAWIDWDDDRDFGDTGEKIIDNVFVGAGTNALTFAIPAGAAQDIKFGRFRLTPLDENGECTATVEPTGQIEGGEVEDYRFILLDPSAIALRNALVNTGTTIVAILAISLVLAGITIRSTYNQPRS